MAKNKNNYFEQNIKRLGVHFINSKTPRDLQFDCIRILRDIARGSLDVREYEEYFKNRQLIDAIYFVSGQKIDFHTVSYQGVQFWIQSLVANNQPVHPMAYGVADHHQKTAGVYQIILNGFSLFDNTGSIEILYDAQLISNSIILRRFIYESYGLNESQRKTKGIANTI